MSPASDCDVATKAAAVWPSPCKANSLAQTGHVQGPGPETRLEAAPPNLAAQLPEAALGEAPLRLSRRQLPGSTVGRGEAVNAKYSPTIAFRSSSFRRRQAASSL
jgi:hypothetical protein